AAGSCSACGMLGRAADGRWWLGFCLLPRFQTEQVELARAEGGAVWIVAGVEMGSLARVWICCCWRGIYDGHWSLAGSWPDADGFGRDGSRWRLDGRR
ncbi:hypothetical protein ACLOJK_038601, partial [Asimina triloba]